MENLNGLLRGFDFEDNSTIIILIIIGVLAFLLIGSNDFGCFFEQNNSLIWIILIVFLIFVFNNNFDNGCC